MAYVITDACIKDLLCVDTCPTDCIHPKKDEAAFEAATQLFVDANGCIGVAPARRLAPRMRSTRLMNSPRT